MREHYQDNLLIVEALSQVAKETSNDIMAEHAWALAEEFAAEEWLSRGCSEKSPLQSHS